MHLHVHVHVSVRAHTHMHVNIRSDVYICIYLCTYVCVYLFGYKIIYICILHEIHMHLHIDVHLWVALNCLFVSLLSCPHAGNALGPKQLPGRWAQHGGSVKALSRLLLFLGATVDCIQIGAYM